MELNAYAILADQKVDLSIILNFGFKELLDKIKRRLSIKQSVQNPWKISLTNSIHCSIFVQWYRAVRDHNTSFGREVSETRERNGTLKTVVIKFSDIRSFTFHFSKGLNNSNKDARAYIKKTVRHCKIQLVASTDNPIVLLYNCKKNSLKFSGKYEVLNRYGNLISC